MNNSRSSHPRDLGMCIVLISAPSRTAPRKKMSITRKKIEKKLGERRECQHNTLSLYLYLFLGPPLSTLSIALFFSPPSLSHTFSHSHTHTSVLLLSQLCNQLGLIENNGTRFNRTINAMYCIPLTLPQAAATVLNGLQHTN